MNQDEETRRLLREIRDNTSGKPHTEADRARNMAKSNSYNMDPEQMAIVFYHLFRILGVALLWTIAFFGAVIQEIKKNKK